MSKDFSEFDYFVWRGPSLTGIEKDYQMFTKSVARNISYGLEVKFYPEEKRFVVIHESMREYKKRLGCLFYTFGDYRVDHEIRKCNNKCNKRERNKGMRNRN